MTVREGPESAFESLGAAYWAAGEHPHDRHLADVEAVVVALLDAAWSIILAHACIAAYTMTARTPPVVTIVRDVQPEPGWQP